MRVLVTGTNGFLGTALTGALRKEGHDVIGWQYGLVERPGEPTWVDIRDREQCVAAMEEVDVVVHLAAMTSEPKMMQDPGSGFDTNVVGTLNVLEATRAHGVERIVFLSSQTVYGNNIDVPEDAREFISPRSPYAVSKYLGEELVRCYGRAYGLHYCILRPSHVYGEGQAPEWLVPILVSRVRTQHTVPHGNDVTRDFIHVDDVVSGLLAVLSRQGSTTLNIGTGVETSITALIKLAGDITGTAVSLAADPELSRDDKMERWRERANIRRITEEVGWKPAIQLEAGLKRVIAASTE